MRFAVFTDRIRSMGEGNLFTGVCLFTWGFSAFGGAFGGMGLPLEEGVHPWMEGSLPLGGLHGGGLHGGGPAWMGVCMKGVCIILIGPFVVLYIACL